MSGLAFGWLFGGSPPNPIRTELLSTSPSSLATSTTRIENGKDKDKEKRMNTPQEQLDLLLEQFKTQALPSSSRFAGKIGLQKNAQPFTVLGLWRHAWFVAAKAKDLAADIALHHIQGPRRPSWGIEMTMLASLARDLASNTHLTDVHTLRAAVSISGLLPTPSDALITPVTYRVRRRGLRGFLKELDEAEDGRRELDGEWVVGKRLWQRLQREWKVGRGERGEGESRFDGRGQHPVKTKERVVLYVHGGAYCTAAASTYRLLTINLSKSLDARVFAINYRLAPDTRFPGPVHDAVVSYLRLTEELRIPPGSVILAGDSAGAGLCLAVLMYLRDEGYEMPGGAILMCPWVDLTMSCASWETNAGLDVVTFPIDPADHMNPVACYLGPERMRKYITHPYASPLFGDFRGLPPLLVQSGDCEVLRDEITLLAHKATLAGVKVTHEIYEDAVHVFQLYPFLDQSRKAIRSCRHFVLQTLPEIYKVEVRAAAEAEGLSSPLLSSSSSDGRLEAGVEASLEEEIGGGSGRPVLLVDGMGEVERRVDGESVDEPGSGSGSGSGKEGRKNSGESGDEDEDEDFPDPTRTTMRMDGEKTKREDPGSLGDALSPSLPSIGEKSSTSSAGEERHSLWRSFSSKSFSSIASLSSFSPFSSSATSASSQPPTKLPNRTRSGSLTSTRRFTRLSSTAGASPVNSLSTTSLPPSSMITTVTATATAMSPRVRTTSHPDMVKLLKEFAMTGPANATSTFGYRYVDEGAGNGNGDGENVSGESRASNSD